jgi:hypothetical protein
MMHFIPDLGGLFALGFFAGLIVFLGFEAVQLARGRVHLRGIGRAALELIIVSPVIVLVIVLANRFSEHFGFSDFESRVFRKWLCLFVLFLVWAPWSHYRALQKSRKE